MRYLGLDVGARNIGIAVGEVLSEELTTINCKKKETFYLGDARDLAVSQIEKLLEVEQADAIVIGLPVDEEGNPTEESKKIKEFADYLALKTNKKIHFVDETLTSFMAEEMLVDAGLNQKEISERLHQASAQLILQQYLEEGSQWSIPSY